MNKQTVNNIAKKLFLGSILSTVIFLAAQSKAIASEMGAKKDTSINVINPEVLLVKYIGNTKDGLYFNVKYNNEKNQDFDIIIKNENEEVLYDGSFNDRSFDKKFLLPQDEDVSFISISLKSDKDNFVQSYNVTISPNSYRGVVVSKN